MKRKFTQFPYQNIKDSANYLRIDVQDDLQWDESKINGYEKCPTVIQSTKVFLTEELVYEGERCFGSDKVDPTVTGLSGRWEIIRVDEGGYDGIIGLLKYFGHRVDELYVTP